MSDEPHFATPEDRRAYFDGRPTEAEMGELLEMMGECKGIGIAAPEVQLTFGDIFVAGKFFGLLHRVVSRRWERSDDR